VLLPPPRAALLALAIALPLASLFAARSFVVVWPVLFMILWRGGRRQGAHGVRGGLDGRARTRSLGVGRPARSRRLQLRVQRDLIRAHWATVAALILLVLVFARALARQRRAERYQRSSRVPVRQELS
jgi:hypothetical protein